ncbi:MAG: hypothetical protein ACYTFX_09540 [Planctomycetota bacterium]|jgi:uncharacterized protein with PIN domain
MAKCPHCEKSVTLKKGEQNQVQRDVVGSLKKETMYSCPHCDKVLGFAHYIGGLLTGRP